MVTFYSAALGTFHSALDTNWTSDGLGYATTYSYDSLGRVTGVTAPDGGATTTKYGGGNATGRTTTVTDPAGHVKAITIDALGRIGSVQEDSSGSNLVTQYAWDVMDHLVWVNKCPAGGCGTAGQSRGFSYDSLGELTQSNNPESGITSYSYDTFGNVASKTDYRGITTTYSYDNLNRLTGKTFSDGTPQFQYGWDGNQAGSLDFASNSFTITRYTGHDVLGRVTASELDISSYQYKFAYSYDLAGELRTETYPSGKVIQSNYDQAGRPVSVGAAGGGTYVVGATYWPHGAPDAVTYGNGAWPVYTFDSVLRPHETYTTRQNNGNYWMVYLAAAWNKNGTLSGVNEGYGPAVPWNTMTWLGQTYGYDALNRITAVNDSSYIRDFSYDEFGNMAVSGNYNVPMSSLTPFNGTNPFNRANNRLNGVTYDLAGNATLLGSLSAQYNPDGRMIQSYDSVSKQTLNYTYDANGERVMKVTSAGTTIYPRDVFGRIGAEYSSVGITPPCTTCYLSYDHLGSVRLITDQNMNVVSRHDYLPYGEEVMNGTGGRSGNGFSVDSKVSQEFTGQQRDETSLDFFHARYFASVTGRFMSPDPQNAGADVLNPQSWNMYAYVGGNPMGNIDPLGLSCLTTDSGSKVDDGDGQGCEGAGVKAGNPDDPDTLNQGQVNATVTDSGDVLYDASYFQRRDDELTAIQNRSPGPAKTGTKPVRFCLDAACMMAVYLPAPPPPKISWAKLFGYLACIAGAPPELMATATGSLQDSTDSVPETQGSTTSWGYRPGKRNGGQQPLNPSSRPELGEAAANAPAYVNGALSCSAIVANAK